MKILCTFDEMIDLVEKCAKRRADSYMAFDSCALEGMCAGAQLTTRPRHASWRRSGEPRGRR